jgi:hypothetical protein
LACLLSVRLSSTHCSMDDFSRSEEAVRAEVEYQKLVDSQKATFLGSGCESTPTHYFIHFHNGSAHWSHYSWGWSLSSLNVAKGDAAKCGESVFEGYGVAVCQECYDTKKEEISSKCRALNAEVKAKHAIAIQEVIEAGTYKSIAVGRVEHFALLYCAALHSVAPHCPVVLRYNVLCCVATCCKVVCCCTLQRRYAVVHVVQASGCSKSQRDVN